MLVSFFFKLGIYEGDRYLEGLYAPCGKRYLGLISFRVFLCFKGLDGFSQLMQSRVYLPFGFRQLCFCKIHIYLH